MSFKNEIFNNRFDLGDLLGGLLLTGGASSVTGIGSFSIFGHSFSDVAFALGNTDVSIAIVAIWGAVSVAFLTNSQMDLGQLMNRPQWELGAVFLTILGPFAVTWLDGVNHWMLQSDTNGAIVAGLLVIGFVIVGYRRGRDKRHSLSDVARALANAGQ